MNGSIRNRITLVMVVFVLFFLYTTYKLVRLNIDMGAELREIVMNKKSLEKNLYADRGLIYDRNGMKLSFSMTKYKISYDKLTVETEAIAKTIEIISEIIGMDEDEIRKKIKNSESDSVYLMYIYEDAVAIKLVSQGMKGVWVDREPYRRYTNDSLAANVIGFSNLVEGELTGIYGIEKEYDYYLTGRDGKIETQKDKWNQELVYNERKEDPAIDGHNIILTIDQTIQHYVEQAIEKGYNETGAKAVNAIVMDVTNGELLAMASYPTFNLNNINEIYDITLEELESLSKEEISEIYNSRWKNSMIQGVYELGSTIKLITAAAALEEGVATPETVYDIGNEIIVAGEPIRCWKYPQSHGAQTFTEAVENSCNPVFVTLGILLGKEKLFAYHKMFGLEDKTEISLPSEVNSLTFKIEKVKATELATMTFGQGIANTQIQIITAISAIVNGGYVLEPHIVKRIENENGEIILENKRVVKRQVITNETSSQMRDIMYSVVESGSGKSVKLDGIKIGGKTGTSEKVVGGSYSKDLFIATFIAVAPIENPKVAIYIFVDEPKGATHGSEVAAPIAKDILSSLVPYMGLYESFENNNTKVEVPNLIGLTYKDGEELLESLNLTYTTLPFGLEDKDKVILDQYPKPGTIINVKNSIIIKFNEN